MENEQEETSVGDDQLNGDTATEVNDDAPTVDATDEKTEQQTKANGKDTEEEEPSEDLLTKIKAQVEWRKKEKNTSKHLQHQMDCSLRASAQDFRMYYFGNVNMQRDKFLIEQTKLDEGWIPMTVMLNFKMLASLTKDVDVILKALETSDLMEISEDKKKIRRSPKHPLPEYNEGYRKAQEARTVYVKGFPLTDTTIDKLKAFFEPYKPFETIVMRKYQDKDKVFKFKGSVFVQFETVDVADAFMKAESVKYEDTELLKKWAADYNAGKAQEKEERRKKKADKTKKTTEQKETEGDEEQPAATDNKLPKGSIIFFSGVSKTCTREDIKECLDKFDADIAYIDFQRGHTEGWVRLQGENAAKPVLDKTDKGKVVIQDIKVTCKILEGEEEDKYLAKVMEEMVASKNKYNKAKRAGKKGRARGAKKRGNSPSRDTVPAKKKAIE